MTDREKLITLLRNARTLDVLYATDEEWGVAADYLLANGVILPPCNVGDTVYYLFDVEIRELKVISYSTLISSTIKHINIHTTNSRGAVLSYEQCDFGKTVFLTREEAEKALKQKEGN